jgi:hypothetical protein
MKITILGAGNVGGTLGRACFSIWDLFSILCFDFQLCHVHHNGKASSFGVREMTNSRESSRLLLRLALSLVTAVTVAATAYICGWLNARQYFVRSEEYVATRKTLEFLNGEIERYKETTGRLPETMADLKVVKEKQLPVDEFGNPKDGWGRSMRYWNEADRYKLVSYGPLGKPGGLGQWGEIDIDKPDTWPERPTLWQFTMMREARPVQIASAVAGIVAFPLCLQTRRKPGSPPSLAMILLTNVVTALFAIFAAVMISGLHLVPGGH